MTPVIFTNGCFDILHQGHIGLLEFCRERGRVVVGLNSDDSVRKLKGLSRPVNSVNTRISALMETGLVDEVVVFHEETPIELIKRIRPDLIVKGGDYDPDQVVGSGLAEVQIYPYQKGFSTSTILSQISINHTNKEDLKHEDY